MVNLNVIVKCSKFIIDGVESMSDDKVEKDAE
jgi:hypothetical protein